MDHGNLRLNTSCIVDLLLLGFSSARVPESFGKWVMVDFELRDFLVLICSHSYEHCLTEYISSES